MRFIDISKSPDYLFHVTLFRGHIPAIKPPPDREAWARAHGKPPMRVETEPRFVTRALACIERDSSTIESDDALLQHASLETICESVWASIEPPPGELDIVLFDPVTKAFWLYSE